MRYDLVTIFPALFDSFKAEALVARGQKKKIISIHTHNLRDWTTDNHKTVDDRPFGGGPGMVMKVEPIMKAVKTVKKPRVRSRVVLFSPRGKTFTQTDAKRLAKYQQLVFICGRYEGVDERVAGYIADEVISIGNFILNGGEVAAMAVMEAVSRQLPGFIAKSESANKSDHAQYTRPEILTINDKRAKVPPVLISGDHAKIAAWRDKHRK